MSESAKYKTIDPSNRFECFEGSFKRQEFPWHYHDFYTVVIVQEGSVTYEFRDNKKVICANECLIINPYVAHRNFATTSEGWNYRVFFFPVKDLLSNSATPNVLIHFETKVIQCHEIFHFLNNIFDRLYTQSDDYESQAMFQLREFLLTRIPYHSFIYQLDTRIKNAINYIEEHLDDKIGISQLAEISCLSPYHFQRLFKQQTGLTAHNFILMKRSEHSRNLLNAGASLIGTALESGFYDQSHFHHHFKKMYGLSPKEFCNT